MTSPEDVPMEEGNAPVATNIPTKAELGDLISKTENESLVEGATWFLVSQKWWNSFVKAVRDGFIEDVTAIDNSAISDYRNGHFYLKPRMAEAVDYTPIPSAVFKKLAKVYQVDDERRDYIERSVVRKGEELVLEVYPRVVHVSLARSRDIKVDLQLKPDDTMESLSQRVYQELSLSPDDKTLFYVMNGENPELIDTSQSIDNYFDTVQKVVVDVQENGEWFFQAKTAVQPQSKSLFGPQNASSSSTEGDSEEENDEERDDDDSGPEITIRLPRERRGRVRSQIGSTMSSIGKNVSWPFLYLWFHLHDAWWQFSQLWPEEVRRAVAFLFGWWILRPPSSSRLPGISSYSSTSYSVGGNSSPITGNSSRQHPGQCGLSNLGNTCFMASALQCLSNMPPLREYFLSGAFEQDLNEDNPLGTRGHLAVSVGELLKGMWSGEFQSVNPRRFKGTIGQFAPRFNGYSQQDAHELMAYVLDGLHEDLNRIKKKPYIEDNDELAKLPEAEYAEKSWEIYKMRNDSIIVDTLHGQLKSTLICPVCEKVSIKFDPFGYLSLPLPPKEQIVKQTVIVMFLDRKWAKFSLGITENTTVAQVEELMLAKLQPETQHHFVFFCVPSQYNDDAVLLRPNDRVRYPGREVYVAEVQHDVSVPGTRLITVHNRVKLMRPCSLPMVYSVPPGVPLTRSFLNETVFETTKKFFISPKASFEMNANGDDDDSMSGSNSADERELYKLLISQSGGSSPPPLPLPPTNDPILFPNEIGENKRGDVYSNSLQIIFQWKEGKYFNNYKGADLIDREMTVSTRRKVDLMESLDWFTTKEQLGEQDSWYCPQCKKHERATKQLDLWKLPDILILHLKRFQYTKWSREKLTWEVVVPVKGLDLTKKVANPNHEKAIYDLIAVSRHYGSLSGGHYTAIGFNDKLQRWIDFNDSSAHLISPPSEPYESSDPYMLVYRRRKLDANGQPIDSTITDPVDVDEYIGGGGRSKRMAPRHQVDENMEMEED